MDKKSNTLVEQIGRDLIINIQSPNRTIGYTDEDIIVIDDLRQLSISKPVKMNMSSILICTGGRMQADLNATNYQVEKRDILFCPPNIIMNNILISPDFTCKILLLTSKIVQGFLRNRISMWNEAFYVNKRYIIHLNEEQFNIFRYYYELLHKRMKEPSEYFQKEIIQSILQATLFEICGALSKMGNSLTAGKGGQSELLFKRFIELLSSNDVKRHSIPYYAKQLCVTPKYLSAVCKSISGKTALKWIQDYLDEDIRYYLRDTNMSIKEIANALAFPNLSFFGKYVRSHFGMSAGEYRHNTKNPDSV